MAKKTNKTDHVLNLLSTGEEMADTTNSAVVTTEEANHELADAIKESLEQEAGVEQEESPMKTPKNYVVINVMEQLVKDNVRYYMDKLEMCTCPRCTVDVMALSLTRLDAKYVVAKREEVSPLLNYYSRKYEGNISIELMKAGRQVMETPHHADN
ncbi:hypothetical protein M2145_000437 [Lachnospiraceae bacterium PF1-21]